MHKEDVIAYFDSRAQFWDAEMIKSDEIIEAILDNSHISSGTDILDVACGTGVMFPYYLQRGVNSVTGIDISPKMAEIAAGKFSGDKRVCVLCGDVEETQFNHCFDSIVVYNAFPHFPEPEKLICRLHALLNDGGCLTIAHGASRETIDKFHEGAACRVSMGLMSAEELKALFEPYFDVDCVISDDRMYQVSGKRKI